MVPAREPSNEQLFEALRVSDPETARVAFIKFLVTPGSWWDGDTPLNWARRVAERHVAHLKWENWPTHKLDDASLIVDEALMALGHFASNVDCPPAYLRRVICSSIEREIGVRGLKGEPWGHEPEEVLDWEPAPNTDGASGRLWEDEGFCWLVGTAVNGLSDVLRPYAILHLLDGLRPVEVARFLGVKDAKARQYLRRALQALVGRKDAKQLLKKANSRMIRNALAEPEVPEDDSQAVLDELIRHRQPKPSAASLQELSGIDPAHDFMTSPPNDAEVSRGASEAPGPANPKLPPDETGAD